MGVRKAKKLERAGQLAFPGLEASEYGSGREPKAKGKKAKKKAVKKAKKKAVKKGKSKGSETAPYVPGSDTSRDAAASIEPVLQRLESKVLDAIRCAGEEGLTDDEIELATELSHQSASARRRGLVLKDLVFDSGRRRITRSGRRATVWVA